MVKTAQFILLIVSFILVALSSYFVGSLLPFDRIGYLLALLGGLVAALIIDRVL